MAIGTRVSTNKQKVTKSVYPFEEGVKLAKDLANAKFPESLEVHVNLGIEAKRSDQNVRGACNLPHGTGKTVKVAVFTQGEKAEQAKAAGADYVGFDDLADKVKKGDFDADVVFNNAYYPDIQNKILTTLLTKWKDASGKVIINTGSISGWLNEDLGVDINDTYVSDKRQLGQICINNSFDVFTPKANVRCHNISFSFVDTPLLSNPGRFA